VAVCLIVIVYLNGHRVNHAGNHMLALLFAAGVALVALFAIAAQESHWALPWDGVDTFGFFANRNHMATLLVMGTMAGAAVAVQSLRVHTWGSGTLALISVIVCIWAALSYSGSRAVVLIAVMPAAWLLIMGREYLRGRVLLAAGLMAGAVLLFFLTEDLPVKKRFAGTIEHLSLITGSDSENGAPLKDKTGAETLQALDLRIPIFLDTVDMVRHAPWTGAGAGQYQYVFPQYRHLSAITNGRQSVHPENDWLWWAAEAGIPATFLLAALVAVMFGSALRGVFRGRARILRTGCLTAAAVVPIHGFFDVPGHHMELAWAACLLLAISSRTPGDGQPSTRLCQSVFRGLGLVVFAAGAFLVYSQWLGGPAPAMVVSEQAVQKAAALYAQEMTEMEAAGGAAPLAPGKEDRLEKAIQILDEALKTVPMDPHLHYLRGAISLYFDDKDAEIDRHFALARILDPTWVAMPLMQATAWAPIDPLRTESLWAEGMRRGETIERLDPGTAYGRRGAFDRIMSNAAAFPELTAQALRIAGGDTGLIEYWASHTSRESLDAQMPVVLPKLPEGLRKTLFRIWDALGSRHAVEEYVRESDPHLLEALKPGSR
jgi:O-antigen ligase